MELRYCMYVSVGNVLVMFCRVLHSFLVGDMCCALRYFTVKAMTINEV